MLNRKRLIALTATILLAAASLASADSIGGAPDRQASEVQAGPDQSPWKDGDSVEMTHPTAVPEPTTICLLLIGSLMLLRGRHQHYVKTLPKPIRWRDVRSIRGYSF